MRPPQRLSKSDKFREEFTMNENTRNAFASYGLEILNRSVLLVLYDAHDEGSIRHIEIRERLDTPRASRNRQVTACHEKT